MRQFLIAALAAVTLVTPLRADQILGPGRIDGSSRVILPGGPTLGRWEGNKYTATPDAITLPAEDKGSTGNISSMSAKALGGISVRPLTRLIHEGGGFGVASVA